MSNKVFYILLMALIVMLALAFVITTPAYADEAEYEEYWDLVSQYSPNDYATAAVVGWFWRESHFTSDALSGARTLRKEFVEEIDAGLADGTSRDKFIRDVSQKYGGFGLGQWCSECYVESLYDYAQAWGTSIADAEMQVAFAFEYMKTENPWNVWEHLENATDAYSAGFLIGKYIDGTALPESVASYSQWFYEKYAKYAEVNYDNK